MDFFFNLAVSNLNYGTQDLCCICGIFCCGTETLAGVTWAAVVFSRWALKLRHTGSRSGLDTVAVVWAQFLCYVQDLSSQTRDPTYVPCIARPFHNHWTTKEVPKWNFFFKEWLTNYQCSWPLKKWGLWHQFPSTTPSPVENPCTTL